MPMDMRDAIAYYLAYTGGQGGQGLQQPRPGIPSNLQGYPQLPSGQFLPTPISDTGPFPGMPQTPPSPDYTGPQPTQMPPMPGNLQGYERLPSGQFLPGGQGMSDDTIPSGVPQVGPPMPYGESDIPGPGVPGVPPVNTPMQAPYGGQTVAGMDPAEWLRMYRGGAGAMLPGGMGQGLPPV